MPPSVLAELGIVFASCTRVTCCQLLGTWAMWRYISCGWHKMSFVKEFYALINMLTAVFHVTYILYGEVGKTGKRQQPWNGVANLMTILAQCGTFPIPCNNFFLTKSKWRQTTLPWFNFHFISKACINACIVPAKLSKVALRVVLQ